MTSNARKGLRGVASENYDGTQALAKLLLFFISSATSLFIPISLRSAVPMIHYICDRCKCSMDPDAGPRYVVHIDVDEVIGDSMNEDDDEFGFAPNTHATTDDETIDHLADLNDTLVTEADREISLEDPEQGLDYLNELLSRGDEARVDPPSPIQEMDLHANEEQELASLPTSFDLCQDCYAKYARNPLSQDRALKLHFSNN